MRWTRIREMPELSIGSICIFQDSLMFYDNIHSALIKIDKNSVLNVVHVFENNNYFCNGIFINNENEIFLFQERCNDVIIYDVNNKHEKIIYDNSNLQIINLIHYCYKDTVFSFPDIVFVGREGVKIRCFDKKNMESHFTTFNMANNNTAFEKKIILRRAVVIEEKIYCVMENDSGYVVFDIINTEIKIINLKLEDKIEAVYKDNEIFVVALRESGLIQYSTKELKKYIFPKERIKEVYSAIVKINNSLYFMPRCGNYIVSLKNNMQVNYYQLEKDNLFAGASKYLVCKEYNKKVYFFPYAKGYIYFLDKKNRIKKLSLKIDVYNLLKLFSKKLKITKKIVQEDEKGLLESYLYKLMEIR